MLTQSEAFRAAMKAPSREIFFRVEINGIWYEKNRINSVEVGYGSSNQEFAIGTAYANALSIEFSEIIPSFSEMDEVKAEIGILLEDGVGVEWPRGASPKMTRIEGVEYCSLGTFVISESVDVDRNSRTTSVTCLDRMVFLEGEYRSDLTYPASLADVALEIANKAGVEADPVSFTRLSATQINKIEGYTYREAIAMVSQFEGGYATFGRDGKLAIRTLNNTPFEISPDEYFMKGLTKNDLQYRLGGISVRVNDANTLHAGSRQGAQIELENSVMTQLHLDNLYAKLENINFYPFTLEWRGNPALEIGDWVKLLDVEGNEFKAPVLSYKMTFNGGLRSTIGANVEVTSVSTTAYRTPLQQKFEKMGNSIVNARGEILYFGLDEPASPKEGDRWFKPEGPEEVLFLYRNNEWVRIIGTGDIDKVRKEVEVAYEEAEAAKQAAKDAFADSVAEAERIVAEQDALYQELFEEYDADIEGLTESTAGAASKAEQALEKAGVSADLSQTAQEAAGRAEANASDAQGKALEAVGKAGEAQGKAQEALEEAGASVGMAKTAKEVAERAEATASGAQSRAQEAAVKAQESVDKAENALNAAGGAVSKAEEAIRKAGDVAVTVSNFEPLVTGAVSKADDAFAKANQIPATINATITEKGLVNGDWVETRIDDATGEINYALASVKGDVPDVLMGVEWEGVANPALKRTGYVEDTVNLDDYSLKTAEYNLSIDGMKGQLTAINRDKLDSGVFTTFKNNEYANDVNGIRQRLTSAETNKLDSGTFETFQEHEYEVTVKGLSGRIETVESDKLDSGDFTDFKSNEYDVTVDGLRMGLTQIDGVVPVLVMGVQWEGDSEPMLARTDYLEESPTLGDYQQKTATYDASINGLNIALSDVQKKKLDSDTFSQFKTHDYGVTVDGLKGRLKTVEGNKLDATDFTTFKANDYQTTVDGIGSQIVAINRDKLDESDFETFKSNEYQVTVEGLSGQVTAIERDKLAVDDFSAFKTNEYQLTVDGLRMGLVAIEGGMPDVVLGIEWGRGESPALTRTDYVEEADLSNYDHPDYIMGVEWDKGAGPTMIRTSDTGESPSLQEYRQKTADYDFTINGMQSSIASIETKKLDENTFSSFKTNEYKETVEGMNRRISSVEESKLDGDTFAAFKSNEYEISVEGIRGDITAIQQDKVDATAFESFKTNEYAVTVDGMGGRLLAVERDKLSASAFNTFKSNEYQLTVEGLGMALEQVTELSGEAATIIMGAEWDGESEPTLARTDYLEESPTLGEYATKTAAYDATIHGLGVSLSEVQKNKLDNQTFTTFKTSEFDVTVKGIKGQINELETGKLGTDDFTTFKTNDYAVTVDGLKGRLKSVEDGKLGSDDFASFKEHEYGVTVAGIQGTIRDIQRDKFDASAFSTFKENEYSVTVAGINRKITDISRDKLDTSAFSSFKENDYEVTVRGFSGQISDLEKGKVGNEAFNSFKTNEYQLTVDGLKMGVTSLSGAVPDYVLGVEWDLSEDPTLLRTDDVAEPDPTDYNNPDFIMGVEWGKVESPDLLRTDGTEAVTSKRDFEVFLGEYNFAAEGWNATNTYVSNNKTQINNLISNASGWQQTITYVDQNQTKINETISQVDSYKQTIGTNGEKVTQLVMTDQAFLTRVGELEGRMEDVVLGVEWDGAESSTMARTGYMDNWTETQVAQLSDSWVLNIKSGGDIKTAINATTDGLRFKGELVHIQSEKTLIDNAVIKSAHIDTLNVSKLIGTTAEFTTLRSKVITANAITANMLSVDTAMIEKLFATTANIQTLTGKTAFISAVKAVEISADKITTGELNAANVNIIGLNVSKLVGDRADFVRTYFNGIASSVSIDSNGIRATHNSQGYSVTLTNGGLSFRSSSYHHQMIATGEGVEFHPVANEAYTGIRLRNLNYAYLDMGTSTTDYGYRTRLDSNKNRFAIINKERQNFEFQFGTDTGSPRTLQLIDGMNMVMRYGKTQIVLNGYDGSSLPQVWIANTSGGYAGIRAGRFNYVEGGISYSLEKTINAMIESLRNYASHFGTLAFVRE